MGVLNSIFHFCKVCRVKLRRRRKRKPLQAVEIKVKMDCDGCERKVKNAVRRLKGVKSVEVNRKDNWLKVTGHVDSNEVLKRVKSTGKSAQFWPYIPERLVHFPHAAGAYDKKAPAGLILNVVKAFPTSNDQGERYVTLFSDENVHACSIM